MENKKAKNQIIKIMDLYDDLINQKVLKVTSLAIAAWRYAHANGKGYPYKMHVIRSNEKHLGNRIRQGLEFCGLDFRKMYIKENKYLWKKPC